MKEFILASSSPRRIELLKQLHLNFEILPSDVEEKIDLNLKPHENVMKLAFQKGSDVANRLVDKKGKIVIAADTMVYIEDELLGKPKNEDEAFWMLKKISGKRHTVYTGVCVIDADKKITLVDFEKSFVYIKNMSDDEITQYIKTGEPFDKAGAYAIQGFGSLIVEKIEGCFYNVVGLPLYKLNTMLQKIGYNLMKGED